VTVGSVGTDTTCHRFFLANFPTRYFFCQAGEPNFSFDFTLRPAERTTRFAARFAVRFTARRTDPTADRIIDWTAGVCWFIPC
jgi:hypothetical protein